MKNQISPKTQNLLFVLAIIAAAALYLLYLFLPLYDDYIKAQGANDSAKARQELMVGIAKLIKDAEIQLDEAKQKTENMQNYKTSEPPVRIEKAFTDAVIAANLSPDAVSVTQEETAPDDPVERFEVTLCATGGRDAIKNLISHINGEFSYRLSDIKITENSEGNTVTVQVTVLSVKADFLE